MKKIFDISDLNGLQVAVAELSSDLQPPLMIGLKGGLGAGKTTFVKYLLKLLAPEEKVSSPSFVLQHEYLLDTKMKIEHWDLYRLNAVPEELFEPLPGNCLRIVEWIDKFPELESSCDLQLEFNVVFSGLSEATKVKRQLLVTRRLT